MTINDIQPGFMVEKGTTDALFILRRLQEKYRAKGKKLCMIFVDLENAFDGVPWRVLKERTARCDESV